MSARVLVSVVIPAYNYERFLPAAIDSVLAQTYYPIELVVVDDGSTDGTHCVLGAYGDRIRSIRKKNAGLSAARNTGIRAANGDFIAFLDADDLWMPEKIERQMEIYAKHPDAVCVGCGVELVDSDLNSIRQVQHDDVHGSAEKRLRDVLLRRGWVGGSGSGALIRRDVLSQLGFFDEGLTAAEDWDLWLRIVEHYPVYNVPNPLVRIRRHFTGTFRNAEKMESNQLSVLHQQMLRTPWAFGESMRRQAMAMIWVDSAVERMFVKAFWSAAARLLRAILAWPLRRDAWHLLAVCLVRGVGRKRR